MTELKPCPFCAAEAVLLGGPMAQEMYSVWCKNSDMGHHINATMDKTATIAAWNTRTEADTLRAEVARLREALSELAVLMDAVCEGDYKPDSFTTQPARFALAHGEADQ